MNIHPIFVHFPIAFLTLYSFLELARFKVLSQRPFVFYMKASLVILGAGAAWVTRLTGQLAAELVKDDIYIRPILQMHKNFSFLTAVIFSTLAFGYLILWLNRENVLLNLKQKPIWQKLFKLAGFLADSKLTIGLALLGFICLTITGGLGGRMVFGPDADPFIKPVLDWLLGS